MSAFDKDFTAVSPLDALSIESDNFPEPADERDVGISAVVVAKYLLDHKLYLSALEYYFEQLERGRQLPKLHSFFADPTFFEQLSPLKDNTYDLTHCQSISTLDSIDIGRISDDGNCSEEKLKVLEYELRKKNEEIQNLRNELTVYTIGHNITGASITEDPLESPAVHTDDYRPHEVRALSVLIHEYLLRQGFRFTAVQFAEESESSGLQDVESWEHVGVNLSKPSSLLHLLRLYWSMGKEPIVSHVDRAPVSSINEGLDCRMGGLNNPFDDVDDASGDAVCDGHVDSAELRTQLEEIASLQAKIIMLETRNAQLSAQTKQLHNQLICLEREHAEVVRQSVGSLQQRLNPQSQVNHSSTTPITVEDSPESDPRSSTHVVEGDDVPPLASRSCSIEFHNHMTSILPNQQQPQLNADHHVFQLATCLDDFVVLVSDRLDSTLPLLRDREKIMNLPLLTQAICLHPDSNARDRLLRSLFNLFSPSATSTDPRPMNDSTLPYGFSQFSVPSSDALANEHQHRLLILTECRRLASYLGPTRLESELIPQLWSQLNQRPPPSDAQRLLILSACGVIAPSIPAHLQSSLMLSILESNLDDEQNELVRAASVRSLACLVTLMSDWNKLPQLVQRLNQLLALGHASTLHRFVALTSSSTNAIGPTHHLPGSEAVSVKPTFTTTINWLLPAIAQWCLELDSLHTTLIDPWLDHLDTYILATQTESTTRSITHDMVTHTLALLGYLVPFIHAWILITLIKPMEINQTYWSAAVSWSRTEGAVEVDQDEELPTSSSSTINTRLVLGACVYQALQPLFDQTIDQLVPEPTSDHMCDLVSSAASRTEHTIRKWTAKNWLHHILLPKLVDLLSHIPKRGTKSITPNVTKHLYNGTILELFVSEQYNEYFACPWTEAPDSEQLTVCLSVCQFLSTFGSSVGANGVEKLLAVCFRDALMNKTELGNYEYSHHAMQTGLLAAYCCLLSSVRSKSQCAKMRMLLTNAIFLHTRECYPLDSIRLTIWCLCLTVELEYALLELILPSLRPCVSCADVVVRRAAATLLHSVVMVLRFALHSQIHCFRTSGQPFTLALDSVYHLVSQLARDDVTGQRKRINPDEADWSVLAVALGPVHGLLELSRVVCRQQDSVGRVECTSIVTTASSSSPLCFSDLSGFEERLYELIGLQLNLVMGNSDSPSNCDSASVSDHNCTITLASHHHFWSLLTFALLSLSDHILPSCSVAFRDKVLLPWLCQLAEISNSLPSLGQRARLADRLFAVFSTAAYSVQLEESLFLWLVPGLDRVRLDLTEAGDTVRTHEVEQFLNDLYARIRADGANAVITTPRESSGLRNTVTTQLAKLTNRSTATSSKSPVVHTEVRDTNSKKHRAPRLSLKRR